MILKIVLIFFSFILHELAHVVSIWYYRLKIQKIKFIGLGLEIITNYDEVNLKEKIIINLSGPMLNVILIVIAIVFNIDYFTKVNFYIFLINILPVIPLDGSKIFEVIMEKLVGLNKSKRILINMSKITGIIFIILGMSKGRYNIVFIGIYIIKKINEEIYMSKINGIERIINRKERFLKKGIYPVRHIAVLENGIVNDVIKNLDFDSIHVINVLDKDLNIIALISEEKLINELIEKGTNITFNDIIKHV